ncbi:nitrite reductase [Streptomyces sp. SID8366]|uniref:(2Fe-2S)-binding protein n=1 Tax=unclassified Streptomyces TaxID=2593676 RepID=UPI000DBA41F4|nr:MULTISPECIES: (2Fe-2S)-binding protein [Streptomyces]MYU03330.1 nitrite reductase [Streptomyces sp. SID8366]MYU64877.1 nitrite reductase [Streptomyces sp. SID69]RAJ57241.1 nitrite reductase (NADH) large subunit [Streptomyces sp. PsTaAH-130]TXJ85213.1 (2Fe-2S)-binding protein [Streptomyces lavendulae]
MSGSEDPLICLCARVPESEIMAAIGAGHRDAAAVRDETGAGSGCGGCVAEVEDLIAWTDSATRA